jgi:hypothetical protein
MEGDPMDKALEQLLEQARKRTMTDKEREEQQINFACGNSPSRVGSTIDSVRAVWNVEKKIEQKSQT